MKSRMPCFSAVDRSLPLPAWLAGLAMLALTACAAPQDRLANTDWQLVRFQSMDDGIGTLMADGGIYTWTPAE